MKNWWHELTGYSVSCMGWFYHMLPGTYEEWTKIFALLIAAVTFIFITLPKAWDFQKRRWTKDD